MSSDVCLERMVRRDVDVEYDMVMLYFFYHER